MLQSFDKCSGSSACPSIRLKRLSRLFDICSAGGSQRRSSLPAVAPISCRRYLGTRLQNHAASHPGESAINPSASLTTGAKPSDAESAKGLMFGSPTSRSFSPQPERTGTQLPSHQLDDLAGCESKLPLDAIKRRPVFPRHLYNPITLRI